MQLGEEPPNVVLWLVCGLAAWLVLAACSYAGWLLAQVV